MNTPTKTKPSTQFIEQLQTDGKASYLTHPRIGELEPAERKLLKQASFKMSLWNWQELDASQLTIEDAFKGTNVQTAMKLNEQVTRSTLITMIGNCIDTVDAKKSLAEGQEYKMVIDELIKLFPAFTIEDWRLCLYMMAKEAFGGYFERLKLAQFVECFTKYDELRQPVVTKIRQDEAADFERMRTEALRYITPEFATEFNPIAARVQKVEWMKGEDRLTYTEREEMRQRDKNRNK
jgi:hypothetical protein